MFLTDEQIQMLTKRVQPAAQRRALMYLKIPFRIRPDGSPVVLEADLNAPAKEKPRTAQLRLS